VVLKNLDNRIDLKNFSLFELEEWLKELGEPKYRARQLFQAIYAQEQQDITAISTLPKSLRYTLIEKAFISNFSPEEILKSADGTVKFLFRLDDSKRIESVLIPQAGYYTLCVSTQVGCAQKCRFCLTGKMGFKRHLKTAEIVNQIIYARRHLPQFWPLRNIVFMGMGEPLHNFKHTLKAIQVILHPLGLNFSHRRVTVSTVGLIPQMLKMAEATNISWAISLHAPDNQIRNFLVPVNKKYPLPALLKAMKKMPLPPRKRFTIEYVLLKEINSTLKHAHALAKLLKDLPVKINLIPFNPHPGSEFQAPSWEEVLLFQETLQKYGYTVTIRQSKGADIGAACGQLDGQPQAA